MAHIAYDGTRYNGFQLQSANRRKTITVQGVLETALVRLTGLGREALQIQAAGRTDAGVHARGQAIHFYCNRRLSSPRTERALNSLLPDDVCVVSLQRVPLDYNVRYSNGKLYSYTIHVGSMKDPFHGRWQYHHRHHSDVHDCEVVVLGGLNVDAMQEAAKEFEGTHDFKQFSNRSRDGSKKGTVKTIRRCDVIRRVGEVPAIEMSSTDTYLRIEFDGDGFLYKQCRHMVGALLAVGQGRVGVGDIGGALQQGHPLPVGRYVVAPPQGLVLEHVYLSDPPTEEEIEQGMEMGWAKMNV